MKVYKIIMLNSLIIIIFISFKQPEGPSGRELFIQNCSSCHKPNMYFVAPPFQKIRTDYGLEWTIEFLKDPFAQFEKRDSKALVGKYLFQLAQPSFGNLTTTEIIKILNYVDSFPYDSAQYQHRKWNEIKRKIFIDSVEVKYGIQQLMRGQPIKKRITTKKFKPIIK